MMRRLTVYLDDVMYSNVQKHARQTARSEIQRVCISDSVRRILEEFFEKEKNLC